MIDSITLKLEMTISANATDYGDNTYWSASISANGRGVAAVGCNGEGRYRTRDAAIRACVAKARENGASLTVHHAPAWMRAA